MNLFKLKCTFLYRKTKKYICKDKNHQVIFTDSTDELSWTLERKHLLYVDSYDPEHRMTHLNDSYIIYYTYNDKVYYLNLETKNMEYTIHEGTSNYNRYLKVLNKDGKIKCANTEIGIELHNTI